MHQGPRFNVGGPPNNQRMSFSIQTNQQPGVMPGWTVQNIDNGYAPTYRHSELEQQYEGVNVPPPQIYPPSQYIDPRYMSQAAPLPTKEVTARSSLAICTRCNFLNYSCQIEMAKCDEIIADLQKERDVLKKENDSLSKKNEQLSEQIKKLESFIEEKRTGQEISESKIATCKGLSPDAMEFSPKRREEVPVVSAKGINEVTHDDKVDRQVDEEQAISKTKIAPIVSQATAWNIVAASSEKEQAARKAPVADGTWHEDLTDNTLNKNLDLNSKENQDNLHQPRSRNFQKQRGSDFGNNTGHEGRFKNHGENRDGFRNVYNKKSDYDKSSRDHKGHPDHDRTKREPNNFRTSNDGAVNVKESRNSGGVGSRNNTDRRRLVRDNCNKQEDSNREFHRDHNKEDRGGRLNDDSQRSQDHYSRRNDKKRPYQDSHGRYNQDDYRGNVSKSQSVKNIVREIDGDLFSAPTEFSLGHCVAQDFRMGSGIAVRFKQEFKRTGELLNQNIPVGGCAFLKDNKANRYIFYLVTKAISSGKPTYDSLHKSLVELRNRCQQFGVTKLAIPRIGCGLDRLDWDNVKEKINTVFDDSEIDICVYNFNAEGLPEAEGKKTLGYAGPRVSYKVMSLKDIERLTALLFFGTEDSHMDSTAISLDEKFHFQLEYKKAAKTVGNVWVCEKNQDYYIYSIIVSKSFLKNQICFVTLEKSLKELSNLLKQHKYEYVGLESLTDWSEDDTFTEKVVTMLRHSLPRTVYELWVCYRNEEADKHKLCSWFASKAQY